MLYWKLVFRTSIVWFIDTALNALAGCLRTKTTDQLINMMGAPTLQPRPASYVFLQVWAIKVFVWNASCPSEKRRKLRNISLEQFALLYENYIKLIHTQALLHYFIVLLQSFVHMSTAFCHCEYEVLEEVTYPSPANPHDIIRICQWMDDTSLEMITPRYALSIVPYCACGFLTCLCV